MGIGIFLIILGGFQWWNPDKIYITSNSHPNTWYDYSKRQDKELALRRRFTKIIEFLDDKQNVFDTDDKIANYWHIGKPIPVEQCLL